MTNTMLGEITGAVQAAYDASRSVHKPRWVITGCCRDKEQRRAEFYVTAVAERERVIDLIQDRSKLFAEACRVGEAFAEQQKGSAHLAFLERIYARTFTVAEALECVKSIIARINYND